MLTHEEPAREDVVGTRSPAEPTLTTTNENHTGRGAESGSTVRGGGFFPVSVREVERAREKGTAAIAKLLHQITTDRSNIIISNDQTRIDRMRELLAGMSADRIDEIRASYIEKYGCDPETNIRSWDFFQPLFRLDDQVALEMVALLDGPRLRGHAATIGAMLDKAEAGLLTAEDRKAYFAMLPTVGLWDKPRFTAADGSSLDSFERMVLTREFARPGISLDEALAKIEAKMPPPDLTVDAPRSKSIAVIVSSAGAQWQELMDWLKVMHENQFHVQLFTPEGRPVAFQADSMCVNKRTAPVGHGCPPHLDPLKETGALAREVLGRTAAAKDFDPTKFGAVYAAGGLGFNEDIAVAHQVRDGDDVSVRLECNRNVEAMMHRALAEKLPQIAICHGPTIYAAVDWEGSKICAGLETASLPPFEAYVGLTGRKERQFLIDVNTHGELEEMGGTTSVLKDVAKMSRVVEDQKYGIEFITGPGPQASANLGRATLELMARRWP